MAAPQHNAEREMAPVRAATGGARGTAAREAASCGSSARSGARHRRAAKRIHTSAAHAHLTVAEPALTLVEQLVEQPAPQPATAGPRILIVEDDPGAAGFIREALELEGGAGWDIQVAPGGQRAIELAAALPPEVVLLDVGLPDVDGAEVYRRLRANPMTARARVLFLTAFTSLDLHQHGIDGGVLLRKPFDVQALAGLVRTLLAAA